MYGSIPANSEKIGNFHLLVACSAGVDHLERLDVFTKGTADGGNSLQLVLKPS